MQHLANPIRDLVLPGKLRVWPCKILSNEGADYRLVVKKASVLVVFYLEHDVCGQRDQLPQSFEALVV